MIEICCTKSYGDPGSRSKASAETLTQELVGMFQEDVEQLRGKPNQADKQTVDDLDSLINSLKNSQMKVKKVEAKTTESVDELEDNPEIEDAKSAPVQALSRAAQEDSKASFRAAAARRQWSPRQGYVSTKCCIKGLLGIRRKYAYNSFLWDRRSLSALKRISNNITFEGEATYYKGNRSDGTYLGNKVGYASNLPRKYLDTEFLDRGTTRTVVVGTADARKLIAKKTYYWRITGTGDIRGQDRIRDRGGVNSQVGRRRCGFDRGFCVFPLRTDILIPAVGPRSYRVPGSAYY